MNWIAAIRGLPANPLPAIWQLQESRRAARTSRWFSSPGVLLLTVLLSALACFLLLRQLLVGIAVWDEGAVPFIRHSLRRMGTGVAIYFSGTLALLFSLARLQQALQFCVGLPDIRRARSGWTLDESLAGTGLGSAELVTAALWHSLRRVLPSLLILNLCLCIAAAVHIADIRFDNPQLVSAWTWLLLPDLLMTSLLLSSFAVLLLCSLALCCGSPGQSASRPPLLAANVYLLQLCLLPLQRFSEYWSPADHVGNLGAAAARQSELLSLGCGMLLPLAITATVVLLSRSTLTRGPAAWGLLLISLMYTGAVWSLRETIIFLGPDTLNPLNGPFVSAFSSWSILPLQLLHQLQVILQSSGSGQSLSWVLLLNLPLQLLLMGFCIWLAVRRAAANLSTDLRV
ncbi:MAG: hypothetical protein R3F46_15080 [bacterium]